MSKLAKRDLVFQGKKRHALVLEDRDIFRFGHEGPFGVHAFQSVEQMVQDLQPGMAHADGIGVGENQADVDIAAVEFPAAGVDLPADIRLGILDQVEELAEYSCQIIIDLDAEDDGFTDEERQKR